MRSHHFAQYLYNSGKISPEDLPGMLERATDLQPRIATLALREGMATPEQLAGLEKLDDGQVAIKLTANNILSETDVYDLKAVTPGVSMRFAQLLIDEDIVDYAGLAKLFQGYDENPQPVYQKIKELAGSEHDREMATYTGYVRIFMNTMIKYMDMPLVIDGNEMPDLVGKTHVVSQRLRGDDVFVAGIYADDDVFCSLASRYSQEEFDSVDEMVIDSVGEFINVINGLYSVEMAKHDVELELELPRTGEKLLDNAERKLVLRMECKVGDFYLILSKEEFVASGITF